MSPVQSLFLIAALCLIAVSAVVAAFIAFSRSLRRIEELKPAERINAWEVFTKAITSIAAIVAGLFALLQYLDQRDRELTADKYAAAQKMREFNITIYGQTKSPEQAQRVFLNEVADLGSTIASLDKLDTPPGVIAVDRFERLYYGQLVLYENADVSNAMINFRDALLKWKNTKDKPKGLLPEDRTNGPGHDPLPSPKKNSDFMQQLSLELSFACRDQLDKMDKSAVSNTKDE
jgi:hypothetical protein